MNANYFIKYCLINPSTVFYEIVIDLFDWQKLENIGVSGLSSQ